MPIIKMTFGDIQDQKAVEGEITDQGRWMTTHRRVFLNSADGKHYQTFYERGSTEVQEGCGTARYDELECVEVTQAEKTIKVWVPTLEPTIDGENCLIHDTPLRNGRCSKCDMETGKP